MKGLKKLALVSAISVASFGAQAELKAMNDTSMGDVTGQAGVTIELQTKVEVGEFRYTDEGDFAVSGIFIGGGNVERDANNNVTGVDGNLDNLLVTIDVEADGDAVIDVHSTDGLPIDYAVGIQEVSLRAAGETDNSDATKSTLLASNIGIQGNLGALNIRVDTATDQLQIGVGFNITDMDMDVDFLGLGVRDLKLMGSQFFEESAASGAGPTTPAGMFANAVVTVEKGVGAITGKEGLKLGIANFAADIHVGAVEMGGTSIGSIAIDNLLVSNTEMLVYGH